MQDWIDLRSDTVTRPTPEMRHAMSVAEVGDDVYGEDPTARALEEKAAEILGKEAALFLPSGSMANQVAIKVWTRPGQQVILEAQSHTMLFELAAMAVISGVIPRPIPTEHGYFGPDEVEARLQPPVYYLMETGLVCVENTHNMAGGTLYPLELLQAVYGTCQKHGIPVHMDGARLFNAAVASGQAPASLAANADSVMFSLSKGLACPIGSILCGPRDFIEEARRVRKMLGGGMRQVGVIAAAGLVALDHMIDRLAEDHENARRLAQGIAQFETLYIDLDAVQTNIVIFEIRNDMSAAQLCEALKQDGILALSVGPQRVRMVTHYHITAADIDRVLAAIQRLLQT